MIICYIYLKHICNRKNYQKMSLTFEYEFFYVELPMQRGFQKWAFFNGKILVLAPMELFEGPKTGHLKVI